MGTSIGSGSGGRAATRPSADGAAGRWDRVAAVAGLLYVVLIVISFFTPEMPGPALAADDMAARIVADRAGHQLGLLLELVGAAVFIVFLVGTWSRLRRHEAAADMFAGLFVVAGAVFYAMILVSQGLYLVLLRAAAESDPEVLPPLAALERWANSAAVPAGAAMFLGGAAVILLTRALPVWLGWLAGLAGVALLLTVLSVFEDDDEGLFGLFGLAGYLLFLVWILATSIVLLLRSGSAPSGEADQPRSTPPQAA